MCVCVCMCVCIKFCCCCLVAKLYATLCDPMNCSLPGSSVHEIFQTKILEWVGLPSPGDLSHPEISPVSPVLAGELLTTESSGKPYIANIFLYIWMNHIYIYIYIYIYMNHFAIHLKVKFIVKITHVLSTKKQAFA